MITIENKFAFKPYQYNQCKDFWEHIFHDKKYNGYVYFCTKNDKTFNNFHYCKASDIPDFLSSLQIHTKLDYYYTPNHFRVSTNGIKRDSNHIFAYTCCVVDIDCHNKKIPYNLLEKNLHTYLQKLDLLVNENECTPYNISLKSGRGLQIIYIYENAISYKVDFKHKKTCDILLLQHEKIIKDFQCLCLSIDKASTKRLSGVFRMPHTYNPKSYQKHFVSYAITNSPYLDIDKLLDATYELTNPIPIYEISKDFQNINKPNIPRCKKVINAVYNYQQDERASSNNPGHENRTCSCFILAPFLLSLYNYNTALDILKDFNANYRQPLPERRLEQILSYCLENYKNDAKCSMRYFKNATILEYLGLDSGDYDIYVTDDYVYNPYFAGISQEERESRKKEKNKRNTTIKKLIQKGVAYPEIAKQTNTSLSTIYRFAKKNTLIPPKAKNPWEELGISKSTYYRRKKKS